jgi:methylmalonyl-CoA mutase C-terminal domain/subunit
MAEENPRILLGKVGLDGHDRGVRMLATWLRDSGMEVVYIGTHNTPEAAVKAAEQEDVDFIGLSFQGAEHIPLLKMVAAKMKEAGLNDVLLVAGGNIPRQDIPVLKEIGVDAIFPPGSPMKNITEYFQKRGSRRSK